MSDCLIVVSRMRGVAKDNKMSTSLAAVQALSDHCAEVIFQATESAKKDGRKTVMDRDIEAVTGK